MCKVDNYSETYVRQLQSHYQTFSCKTMGCCGYSVMAWLVTSSVPCKAILGIKCINSMELFSSFEVSLYRNYTYVKQSNKLKILNIKAFFDLFNSLNRLQAEHLITELKRTEEDLLLLYQALLSLYHQTYITSLILAAMKSITCCSVLIDISAL